MKVIKIVNFEQNKQTSNNMMELTDLRVEKFNKVADISNLSSPDVLSQLTVMEKFEYAKNVHSFHGLHNQGHYNQVYISQLPPRNFLSRIVYLKLCPMILFLKGEPQSIIIEEAISKRLSDYLTQHEEANSIPCLSEAQAYKIIAGLTRSANNYRQCKLQYDCISPKNVVQNSNSNWELSVVGLTLGVDKDHPAYSRKQIGEEYRLSLGLGCLLFQLIFGFSPLPPPDVKWEGFYADKYLKTIQEMPEQKLLKIYHFTERVSLISPQCSDLLRRALSGQLPWSAWCQHQYFNEQIDHKEQQLSANHEIMMINSAKPKDVALVMSAIDFKKNKPLQRLYPRQNSSNSLSPLELIDYMQKNNLLREIGVSEKFYKTFKNSKIDEKQKSMIVPVSYFYSQGFDREQDSPCQDLIKLIQSEKAKNPNNFSDGEYQARLKLYGFPYAVAFELLKVEQGHTIPIKKRIKTCFNLLMQLSAMNQINSIQKLHSTSLSYRFYEQLKPALRENINELYQYFLNQAMRNYNLRGDLERTEQKAKKKLRGLEYYRLCLKLLQASLVMRKGGHDLNLNRIVTSQRKEVENDLSELLAKYFPKKV